MAHKSPYDVIKMRYVTEKAKVLEGLHKNSSNICVKRCETPKYVFIVDNKASKKDVASAVEQIYAENNIKVIAVNTVNMKPKKRAVRGRVGYRAGFKKAIVTLQPGNVIGDKV